MSGLRALAASGSARKLAVPRASSDPVRRAGRLPAWLALLAAGAGFGGPACHRAAPAPRPEAAAQATPALVGRGEGLVARLEPLDPDPVRQRALAGALAARFGLAAGEPWRLTLARASGAGAGSDLAGALAAPLVLDERGQALAAVALGRATPGAPADPLATLLGAASLAGADGARARVLWGRAPGAGARLETGGLVLALGPAEGAPRARPLALAFGAPAAGPAAAAAPGDLARENERLRAELASERERRLERERAWYDYNERLAALGVAARAGAFPVDAEVAAERERAQGPPAAPEAPAPDPAEERRGAILASLRALLALAELPGYDLLEAGAPLDDPQGGVGPVVFRLLDDRGRLAGSLVAERLRLEGSRSGRTLTLVLEDGHESRGGERVPFADGARRVVVPFLDPEPWVESLPELFRPGAFSDVQDDGTWDREALRRSLNDLLARDTSAGWFRVRGIGGVLRGVLTDVQIEELDKGGRLVRRLFADRVTVLAEPPGVLVVLEGGVSVRGEAKEAFRDGVHRIYLPRASAEAWRAAGVPGLEPAAPPPPAAEPAAAATGRG